MIGNILTFTVRITLMPISLPELNQYKAARRFWGAVAVVLIVATIISILVLASVPPVSKDALTHHLAVPKLYLDHGGMYEIPSIVFSYFPMNLDLLYIIPLYFGNDIAAKYIHFIFALFTCMLIFSYLRKRLDRMYALLGVITFLSVPIIIKLSITVYVDLGLIFFSTASLMYLLKWADNNFAAHNLLLSAVFCGLALGTKYNGLITLFLLTLFVPFMYLRDKRASGSQLRAAGYGTVFFLTALLIFSPWMIRNFIWKGNPVYPLYHDLFISRNQPSGPAPEATSPANEISQGEDNDYGPMGHFAYRSFAFDESGWQIALIPLRVFFQGRDDTPKYFDGVLNPYLFFFALLAFVSIRGDPSSLKREKTALGAFSILFLLFVFFQEDMRIRWIAPIIPPLVILSVYGFSEIIQALDKHLKGARLKIGKGLAVLVIGIMLVLNISYLVDLFGKVAPLEYITGRVSREDYISKFRPAYKLHEYAGRTLPEDSKILGLFLGNRSYYSHRDIVFEDSLLRELIGRYNSDKAVGDELNAKGITHLIIRQDLFEKWVFDNFDAAELSVLKAFFSNHLSLMYANVGYVLYKLI